MQVLLPQLRKPIIVMIALVLVALAASKIPFSKQHSLVNVTVSTMSTVNKPLWIKRAGSAVYATKVPVYSEGVGRVSDVYVASGQVIKAGQPLMKLEMTGEERQTIESPTVTTAPSSFSKEAYENALKDYTRYKTLYEQGAIPRKQLEMAEARLQAAQGTTESVQEMTPQVTVSKVVSGPVTIQAPIDGTVTGTILPIGSGIQEGQELLSLGSGQETEVVVPLEQKELYQIELGSLATIEVGGEKLPGQISSIYPEIKDTQIISFVAHVKLMQTPAVPLAPGTPVTLRLATGEEASVMAVPKQAVQQSENQAFIFLAVEGKAIRQQVTLGEQIGDLWEITTPIPQNSLIITNPVEELKNEAAIKITE